jgi:hypothetical protein
MEEPMGSNPGRGDSVNEADMADLVAAILASGEEWAWQMCPETIAQMAWPNRAWQCESGYICTSDIEKPIVLIRALAGDDRDVECLIRGLLERYPGRSWRVIPVVPEALRAELFGHLGFYRDKLSQWHMRITF